MATNLVKVEWNTKEKTKFFVWIPETHPKFDRRSNLESRAKRKINLDLFSIPRRILNSTEGQILKVGKIIFIIQ